MSGLPATRRSVEEINDLIGSMSPGLQYSLVSQYEVNKECVAELAANGFKTEDMWPPMGTERAEVIDTLKIVINLDWEAKEGRRFRMKLLAVHVACKSKVASRIAWPRPRRSGSRCQWTRVM